MNQRLVSLRHPQLPGQARPLNGAAGGRSGTAVVAGDQHHLGPGLGNARGNGAHARLADQLDADPGEPVGVFQVVDQLGQVLDGVDVMVGRRGDQRHAGGGTPGLGDPGIHLFPRQVPPLARLGPLGHLDLNLVGADQILTGDAEAARGHLFDGGAAVAVQPLPGLAALAGVGFSANAVHGNGHALVGLLGDGAIAHGPSLEPPDNALHRLHLLHGDSTALRNAEVQQAPQRVGFVGKVHQSAVLLKDLIAPLPRRLLQKEDGAGVVHMVLLVRPGAELVDARGI